MSLWTRISEALAALANGQSLAEVFDRLRAPPQRTVGFAIAVIALGAKMAKADGQVTRDEVTAFREVFQIAAEDEAGAARVFNLARQDVAGYQDYARRIQAMFSDDPSTLCDLMEGLFHIALADGFYHPDENAFLENVARIFGQTDQQFRALRARFVADAPKDPYDILGVDPAMPMDDIRAAFRQLVRNNHPDAMIARGVPSEAVQLAEKRMADINRAWEEISTARTVETA
ncbi:DnaJ-like protein DjlA [Tritonibacter multivorans]|uniref:DnaJ-like protein DjlA n=1 Tax=Tritonibacter multivorans TaxID=928856 RepID=A0A0P1GI24_9RHOB|nr:molecular chaperone DjiA [Tritonibacter multivorans]MDA7420707.1 molecular chaperone DjiA [Tritonibacter multivorans]CUH81088.1 DnaJ-like protein DjlA [Tritonibacter multivorans]SFC27963.1 DnaJ like chaperone protein [Tritonibacter multivorans]